MKEVITGKLILLSPRLMLYANFKMSEGFGIVSDGSFDQRFHIVDDSVNPKSLSLGMEMNDSNHCISPPMEGLISPTIPESPFCNGCVDASMSDGTNGIKEIRLPVPRPLLDEDNNMKDLLYEDPTVCGLEMEEMDVVLHTDFINYCNKFYSAIVVLISANCIQMKASSVNEELAAFKLEWDVNDIGSIESYWSSVASIAKVKMSLLSKDAMPAENAQETSGAEVVEFLVYDPDWSRRQEQIMSLNVRYKEAWSTGLNVKVSVGGSSFVEATGCSSHSYIPNFEVPFEEFVYLEGDVDAVSICKRDVDLLQPEIFINDTLIDFYTKFLKNRIPPEERHRFHFFNSFFFRKLADLDKNHSSDFDNKAAFQRVRKWTRKVNIFEKDCIFIPINYNLHWSLIVICHPGEIAKFSAENMDESLKVPCILHMDSIRGSHADLKDIIRSYLWEEWKERLKETSEDIHSRFINLRYLSLELPQQENCSDCGLFLLHYVELFMSEAPANFTPFLINKYENFLKPDWFMPAEASLKRVHIQRLIYELLGKCYQASPSPFSSNESLPLTLAQNNQNEDQIEIIFDENGPGKSWQGNLSYSLSFRSEDMGLLDSDMGMKELIEQCQHYDQEVPLIREEVEDDGPLSHSILGQDGPGAGAGHIGCHMPGSSSDDDSKRVSDAEKQGASSSVDKDLEQTKEDLENDMGNRAENVRKLDELDESCRVTSHKDPQPSTIPEDSLHLNQQKHNESDNRVDDKPVIKGPSSDSDEEHTAKRVRLTPLHDQDIEPEPILPG